MDYVDENEDPVERALAPGAARKSPPGCCFSAGDRRMYAKSFGEITLPSVVLTTDAARLGFDNLSSVTTDDVEAAGMRPGIPAGKRPPAAAASSRAT